MKCPVCLPKGVITAEREARQKSFHQVNCGIAPDLKCSNTIDNRTCAVFVPRIYSSVDMAFEVAPV